MNTEFLSAAGIDFNDGFTRCCNNLEMYRRFLIEFTNQTERVKVISEMYKDGKYKELFERLHDMKGVSGNLGMKSLFATVTKAVEMVRNEDYSPALAEYINEIDKKFTECAVAVQRTFNN